MGIMLYGLDSTLAFTQAQRGILNSAPKASSVMKLVVTTPPTYTWEHEFLTTYNKFLCLFYFVALTVGNILLLKFCHGI